MIKKELISVIVPIYNVEAYLPKCIESIMNQTYKNIEIILVDDGSPDSCGTICDEYALKDKRIKVIHKVNGGVASARNIGLDVAKGSLIGFVDSDDWIEPTMYEELYNHMIENNSDISTCSFYYYKNNQKSTQAFKEKQIVYQNDDKFKNLNNENRSVTLFVWNKLFKKELFDNIKFPMNKIYEDSYIICDLLEKANKISYLYKPLYHYIYRDNSIVNSFKIKQFDRIDAYDRNIYVLNKNGCYDVATSEKNEKVRRILNLLSKMKVYKVNNQEVWNKYYQEANKTSKEIKWKDSNKYVKRFKIGNKAYLYFRYIEYKTYYSIKTILNRQ